MYGVFFNKKKECRHAQTLVHEFEHTHTLSLPYHADKHATFTIYGAPFKKKIKASKS